MTLYLSDKSSTAVDVMSRRHRFRPIEFLPWLIVPLIPIFFPGYLLFGSQVLVMCLLALSVDLILGYAGVVSLGQAAFYGMGAYAAGLLAVHGWNEPLTGLLAAGVAGALLGLASGVMVLRTHGLALLMLTLAVTMILGEVANKAVSITGGADGLRGIVMRPLLGVFPFDFSGHTGYWYAAAVLFVGWLVARRIVYSPFGHVLAGIRENPVRMQSLGISVQRRLVTIYTLSAAMAGVAGAVGAQTNQFVGLRVFSFEVSGDAVLMVIIGGVGRLYGAFVGAPLYLLAQDILAKESPVYWYFWLGLILALLVLFVRGGILDLADTARRCLRERR